MVQSEKTYIEGVEGMAFRDYSKYLFGFEALDLKMPDSIEQKKYYNRWMQKYSAVFNGDDNFQGIEWDLRCKKALREIFSSATFFMEAKKNLEMGCFSSYYFGLYYSLFHAIYSVIFLDANSSMDKLFDITHKNVINTFVGTFANSKADILSKDIGEKFHELKYKREYYSYVTPFNNVFSYKEDLQQLEEVLMQCYQLSSFHSLMIENSYGKKHGKITMFESEEEIYRFGELFDALFSKKDGARKSELDSSSKFMKDELLKYGFKPTYIALELDHQIDEFHTYDGFYKGLSEQALKITDIWSFLYRALSGE